MDGFLDNMEYDLSHARPKRSLVTSHVTLNGDEYSVRRYGECVKTASLRLRAALLIFSCVNLRRADLFNRVPYVCHNIQMGRSR